MVSTGADPTITAGGARTGAGKPVRVRAARRTPAGRGGKRPGTSRYFAWLIYVSGGRLDSTTAAMQT